MLNDRSRTARAVEVRGLLQGLRDRLHKAPQHPDRERQREGDVRQDQRTERVQQAEVPHLEEQGDGERLPRHHLGHQKHDQQGGPEPEAESRHGGRGEKGDERRDEDDTARHHKAVDEIPAEILLSDEPRLVAAVHDIGAATQRYRSEITEPLIAQTRSNGPSGERAKE